jgi:hypothetical protein
VAKNKVKYLMDLFNSTASPSHKPAFEKFAKLSYPRQQTQKVRALEKAKRRAGIG